MNLHERGAIINKGWATDGGKKVYHYWVITDPDEFNQFAASEEAPKTGLAYFPGYEVMTPDEYQQYIQTLSKD